MKHSALSLRRKALSVIVTQCKAPLAHYGLVRMFSVVTDGFKIKTVAAKIDGSVNNGLFIADVHKDLKPQKRRCINTVRTTTISYGRFSFHKYGEGFGHLVNPYVMSELVTTENLRQVAKDTGGRTSGAALFSDHRTRIYQNMREVVIFFIGYGAFGSLPRFPWAQGTSMKIIATAKNGGHAVGAGAGYRALKYTPGKTISNQRQARVTV